MEGTTVASETWVHIYRTKHGTWVHIYRTKHETWVHIYRTKHETWVHIYRTKHHRIAEDCSILLIICFEVIRHFSHNVCRGLTVVKVRGKQVWVVGIGTMLRAGRSEVRIPAGTRRFSPL
jgi:trimethylamine:corrinoid methyltransferase-like protein